jgi:hypothetical protein
MKHAKMKREEHQRKQSSADHERVDHHRASRRPFNGRGQGLVGRRHHLKNWPENRDHNDRIADTKAGQPQAPHQVSRMPALPPGEAKGEGERVGPRFNPPGPPGVTGFSIHFGRWMSSIS